MPDCEPEDVPSGASDCVDCPRCSETIKRKAKMCRYCNLDLAGGLPAPMVELSPSGHVPSVGQTAPCPVAKQAETATKIRPVPQKKHPNYGKRTLIVLLMLIMAMFPQIPLVIFLAPLLILQKIFHI
jgi:hypothetical protein